MNDGAAVSDRAHTEAQHGPTPGSLPRLRHLYRQTILHTGHEERLLISASFLIASLLTRAITHAIRDKRFRFLFRNVSSKSGLHIHHLVFGICGLLLSGFLSTGFEPQGRKARGALATAFGASSALTLDEFALWLNLEDVYWLPQGRESVDALIIGGALSAFAGEGAGLWRAMFHDTVWLLRGRKGPYPRA